MPPALHDLDLIAPRDFGVVSPLRLSGDYCAEGTVSETTYMKIVLQNTLIASYSVSGHGGAALDYLADRDADVLTVLAGAVVRSQPRSNSSATADTRGRWHGPLANYLYDAAR